MLKAQVRCPELFLTLLPPHTHYKLVFLMSNDMDVFRKSLEEPWVFRNILIRFTVYKLGTRYAIGYDVHSLSDETGNDDDTGGQKV